MPVCRWANKAPSAGYRHPGVAAILKKCFKAQGTLRTLNNVDGLINELNATQSAAPNLNDLK